MPSPRASTARAKAAGGRTSAAPVPSSRNSGAGDSASSGAMSSMPSAAIGGGDQPSARSGVSSSAG